jgi:hypothetical protein
VRIKGLDHVLRTIGDVRELILGLPKEFQKMATWREVCRALLDAAKTGDATEATIALEIVLMLNGLLDRRA